MANWQPKVVTNNPRLPHIKEAIDKHWDILKIDPKFKTIFSEKPFMAFKRNWNLRYIIGQKTIVNNKVKRNIDIITQKGWSINQYFFFIFFHNKLYTTGVSKVANAIPKLTP